MEFEHDIQRRTHEQVGVYLAELFDSPFVSDDGHSYVRYGSTVLEIATDAYGPEEAIVTVTAHCAQGLEVEEKLLRMLLELNHQMPIGAFALLGSDVFFSHGLPARQLAARDLLTVVAAVANVADEYDDRLVAEFGGQTALDRIQESSAARRRRLAAERRDGTHRRGAGRPLHAV